MRGREYPTHPMVGVGVVVFNDQNQILLVQRGNEPGEGLWALPGGLVEIGEELKAAARWISQPNMVDLEIPEMTRKAIIQAFANRSNPA